jgi:hypothetical protein
MAEAASDAGLGPPSYEQAITNGGQGWWLELVVPYVSVGDYPSLCLVSRRFYDVFCPRLWKDPLVTVRILGLDPGNGSYYDTAFPVHFMLLFCSPLPR